MRPAAFALVFCLSLAVSAQADDVPGIGRADYNFFSLDPSPVRIEFKSGPFNIPRKYVVGVLTGGYQSRNGPLPDVVPTAHIEIALVDDDGEAWTVALTDQRRKTGRPVEAIVREMRPRFYRISLYSNNNPKRRIDVQASLAFGVRQPERYENMLHYKNGSDIYVGGPSDSFESIRRNSPSNVIQFCNYTVEITEKIFATAHFLDFRHHGGRAYANKRARFLRDVICRFVEGCQPEIAGNGAASIPFIADQKQRVCIERDGPHTDVVMGLTPKIPSSLRSVSKDADWTHRVESLAWLLRVPETASKRAVEAWLRPGVTRSLSYPLIYPEMAPFDPIYEELRAAWSGVPRNLTTLPACATYAEISFEELTARHLSMELLAPAQYPEIADRSPLLDCDSNGNTRLHCLFRFQRDGWRVSLTFRSHYKSEADAIRDKVNAYLDKITLSRDPVPTIAIDKK